MFVLLVKTCAFLGNDYDFVFKKRRRYNSDASLREKIKEQIIYLIENEGVFRFFVGEIGAYERDAYDSVLDVQKKYPKISIILVISKMTDLHEMGPNYLGYVKQARPCDDFIFPPKCENGYKRLCIVYRNRYIIENTDFIIAYNKQKGRAYQFCEAARKRGVKVIELSRI